MKILITLLAFCFLTIGSHTAAAQSFGIAATVNKEAISEADLNSRLKLILTSAGLKNTATNRKKARSQALESLIEEQLKIQEAEKQSIEVTPEDVSLGFEKIASQNNLTSEQFSQVINQQGIPKETLLHQIKSQIAWSKVIAQVLRPRIEVSENDVNAKMQRVKDKMGEEEYLVSEIFLPVKTESEDTKIKELASKITNELRSRNASFEAAAAQFSKSANAPQGGSMGWIQDGELPKELNVVIKSLSEGQISPPVRGIAGYHILEVKEKRFVSDDTLPSDDAVLQSIGLERLDRLQQRYLADIRSAAFIDKR